MGQIVGGAAKPKRCNLNKLSQLGIPAAGEHILVSSDNSMNAAGQGNFDCYIEGDGQKAATALKLNPIENVAKQLEAIFFGSVSDDYTVSGYDAQYFGSYNFKAGFEYTFLIETSATATLYFIICDAEHNTIRANEGVSSFPKTIKWTPSQDYDGACLYLRNGGTNTYTITVTGGGFVTRLEDVETLKPRVSDLEDITNPLKEVLVDSDTITSTKVIDYLTKGYIYKVVISASTATDAYIHLRGVTNTAYRVNPVGVGTYYIPVFDNGVINNIRISASGSFSITYSIYRISFKDFIDANGQLPLNYVKSLSDTLSFTWGQGYHTDYKTLNNNSQWCSTNIQYNRGRVLKITYNTNDYYCRFRHLSVNSLTPYDGAQVTSGYSYNTVNFGPWCLQIRKSDYSPITPEEAASAISIEQISGSVYEAVFGNSSMKDTLAPSFDFEARVSALEAAQPINPRLGTLELGKYMHHLNVEAENPYIPSQSLYDIAYAKSLGFKMIEANLQVCSDGVVVVKHGIGGKLGAGLRFADGSGLSADTLFSSVTSTALRQYVTYNARQEKYCGYIPTLDEFCAECAQLNMIPFLRGVNTESLNIARKYLPDERIIVEGLTSRGDFRGMMTIYAAGATATEILAACQSKGQPFYYAWSSASSASDALFEQVSQTLHEKGYLLGSAYVTGNNALRLFAKGLDINVSTFGAIPPFETGNAVNILSCGDSHIALVNATYDATEDTITMQSGGTLVVSDTSLKDSFIKVCMKIRYNGTLTIRTAYNNDNGRDIVGVVSDGAKEITYSAAAFKTGNAVRITADALTTIYEFKLAVSIV